jgi:predicted methyltransferase
MKRVLAALVVLVIVAPAHPAHPAPPAQKKSGLFAPLDLGLLDAPDREQWQKPDQIMDALQIADGSVVADLGAGGGWFTVRLARRVGQFGRVYAEDVQPEMIELIKSAVQRERLTNVMTILGTPTDPRLPQGIDAALVVDSYHEMELEDGSRHRDPVTLLKNIARSLKPQGRLGVVDFLPGGGGPGPDPGQRVDPKSVIRACEAAGLQFIKREEVPPFEYLLIFRKPGDVPTERTLRGGVLYRPVEPTSVHSRGITAAAAASLIKSPRTKG